MTAVVQRTRLARGLLVALRLLLLVGLLLAGWHALSDPDDRQLGDLQRALARGQVTSVTVAVPPEGSTASGERVRWSTGGLRPHLATYAVSSGQDNPVLQAVAASPRPPDLTVVHDRYSVDTRSSGVSPAALAVLGALLLLLSGPAPVLATRWAWLWLMVFLPVALAVFVVLESPPLWRPDRPVRRRRQLTGGVAFLCGAVVAALGANAYPDLTGLLWRHN